MVLPVLERAGNVATTFSLRPHGSGIQHDVHFSGHLASTLEQVSPALYMNLQSMSRMHLSRRQQALST